MEYRNQEVIEAYKLYSKLARIGNLPLGDVRTYTRDERIEELMNQFATQDQATIIIAGGQAYLVPIASSSPFQMSNETIKKLYLPNNATNLDIYLMYVSTIILLGEFYNSYQTKEPTRAFITMEEWLEAIQMRMENLAQLEPEYLKKVEEEQEYNWQKIIEKWMALDDVKEKAKKQAGVSASRVSFLNMTKNFLERQDIIKDIGNNEFEITEKTKVIIQRYYMDYEYNRGLLDFIYQFS
ncbi:MAG: DUF6063 family protein [Cellulosilyticum sp.]|nr:DUF6063 family protein [Cellulosilyticum sp.]